jgi:hypothetical protein
LAKKGKNQRELLISIQNPRYIILEIKYLISKIKNGREILFSLKFKTTEKTAEKYYSRSKWKTTENS